MRIIFWSIAFPKTHKVNWTTLSEQKIAKNTKQIVEGERNKTANV